jgi:hypothetical protein
MLRSAMTWWAGATVLVLGPAGEDAQAQKSSRHEYVAERATTGPVDGVMACLTGELQQYRPGRLEFRTVSVTQGMPTGSGAIVRGPTETRNPPPQDVNVYASRAFLAGDRTIAQVIARTTRLEVTETQSRQRQMPVKPEAKKVADRVVAKCAAPIGTPGASGASEDGPIR